MNSLYLYSYAQYFSQVAKYKEKTGSLQYMIIQHIYSAYIQYEVRLNNFCRC